MVNVLVMGRSHIMVTAEEGLERLMILQVSSQDLRLNLYSIVAII